MTSLRIGLAQTRQTNNFEVNFETILRFLKQAADEGVQILCFPETQSVGYRVDIADIDAPSPIEKLKQLHDTVAGFCAQSGMACILGTETPNPSDPAAKPHNSALVINEQGEQCGVYHKT